MFKMAVALGCIAAALLLGAFASSLNREAREANPQTPAPTTLARAALSGVDPTRPPATSAPPAATANPAPITTPSPDASLPITFTCPPGWTAQNVTGRRYAFCTPPGWSARIGPANVPRAGEPDGSAVRAVSTEQMAVSGTPRVGASLSPSLTGSVVDIFITSYQITADLPKQPLCSGAASGVGGVVVAACDLDNASDARAPFRYRALYGRPNGESFLLVVVTLGKDVTNEQAQLARQISSTVVFY
jgi:hypothetical protein